MFFRELAKIFLKNDLKTRFEDNLKKDNIKEVANIINKSCC